MALGHLEPNSFEKQELLHSGSFSGALSFSCSHVPLVSFEWQLAEEGVLPNACDRTAQDIVLVSCRLLVSKKYEARAGGSR